MSRKVKVANPQTLRKSLEDSPANTVWIEPKKENNHDTKYFNASFALLKENGDRDQKFPACLGIRDVMITETPPDPSKGKEDARNRWGNVQVGSRVSKMGDAGIAIKMIDTEFQKQINELEEAGELTIDGHKISTMTQTHYSKKQHVPEEKRGTEMVDANGNPDPKIRFKVDFSLYSKKHPISFMREKPKSILYDYSKPTETADEFGVRYERATVDGEPVNKDNVHKFLTYGSTIKLGRIDMNSVSQTDDWISWPMTAGMLLIEPAGEDGFEDPFGEMMGSPSPTPAPAPVPAANTENTEGGGDDDKAVEDMLNAL